MKVGYPINEYTCSSSFLFKHVSGTSWSTVALLNLLRGDAPSTLHSYVEVWTLVCKTGNNWSPFETQVFRLNACGEQYWDQGRMLWEANERHRGQITLQGVVFYLMWPLHWVPKYSIACYRQPIHQTFARLDDCIVSQFRPLIGKACIYILKLLFDCY